jgi:4-hydroxy-tetrahydrodipicolinate reductase
MSLKILLNGSKGRMGQAIAAAAADMQATISAAVDAGDNAAAHLAACDVIIDFSSHHATGALLELALAHRKPIVIGTTGHAADEKKRLLALAAKVPCVWASTCSSRSRAARPPCSAPTTTRR